MRPGNESAGEMKEKRNKKFSCHLHDKKASHSSHGQGHDGHDRSVDVASIFSTVLVAGAGVGAGVGAGAGAGAGIRTILVGTVAAVTLVTAATRIL